jgi:hypothetical protein
MSLPTILILIVDNETIRKEFLDTRIKLSDFRDLLNIDSQLAFLHTYGVIDESAEHEFHVCDIIRNNCEVHMKTIEDIDEQILANTAVKLRGRSCKSKSIHVLI